MLIERQPDMSVVAEAVDGVDALEGAQTHRPDVAVLDVSMPRMTGRAGAAPNSRIATPGASESVAPMVASRFFNSSCPSSTVVG